LSHKTSGREVGVSLLLYNTRAKRRAHTRKSNSKSAVAYASYGKSKAQSQYRARTSALSAIHNVKHCSHQMFFWKKQL